MKPETRLKRPVPTRSAAVNTFKGLVFDRKNEKIIFGGISGNAIFPLACRLVYNLYGKVSIPVIGLGGISSGQDALLMVLSGASAVGIGTGMVIDPCLPIEICETFTSYLKDNNKKALKEIVGLMNEKREKAV